MDINLRHKQNLTKKLFDQAHRLNQTSADTREFDP